MKNRLSAYIMISLFLCIFPIPAQSLVLDFTDNAPPPPGFYGLVYYSFYDAPRLKNDSGKTVKTATGENYSMIANVIALKPAYYFEGFGTLCTLSAVIPYWQINSRNLETGNMESNTGLGDMAVNAAIFLYQNKKTGTFLGLMEYVSMPTGDYSKNRAMGGGTNIGLNYWYLMHQLSFATSFAEKCKWSYDMNINYYQRLKRAHLEPGDSLELEGILGYGLTDSLRLGVFGRYLFDIKDSTYFDADAGRTKIFSAGPSVAYNKGKFGVYLRYTYDYMARNAPQGNQIWLRVNYSF